MHPAAVPPGHPLRRALDGLALALVWTALSAATARAASPVAAIEPGREDEILALVAPFVPDGEVVAGWRLTGIAIERHTIRFVVEDATGGRGELVLGPPSAEGGEGERTASFTLRRTPAGESPALAALAAAVRRNDSGDFWTLEVRSAPAGSPPASASPSASARVWAWATDGLVAALALLAFLAAWLFRALRRASGAVWLAFGGVAVAGLLLRVFVSPDVSLEAWPYQRIVPLASALAYGPGLRAFLRLVGGSAYLTEIISATSLVLAVATPLALFAYARALFGDDLEALAAAAVLAVLPMHLRFAQSDVAAVQSVAASTLALVVVHAAVAGPSWRWRAAALALLPSALAGTFGARPEALAFVPLLLVTALVLGPHRWRAPTGWVAAALTLGVAAAYAVVRARFAGADLTGEVLDFTWLPRGVAGLVSPAHNTFVNPAMTPPAVLLLALAGAVVLGRRRAWLRGGVLVAWLAGFFAIHALVVVWTPLLATRYQLHAAVPVALLAAPALVALWRWRRAAGAVAAGLVALSPLLHADFVRDTDYNEQREFAFVRALRPLVPADCTVLEYTGPSDTTHYGSRFARIGQAIVRGDDAERWVVVEAGGPSAADGLAADALAPAAREVLQARPACLLVYRGLACWTQRGNVREYAPACAQLARELPLEPLFERRFASRCYEELPGTSYCDDGRELVLSLARVR